MEKINFNSLNAYHVLKSSDKYLIGIAKNSMNQNLVFKIANKDNNKLNKEINRINELRTYYPFMNQRLVPIINQGILEKGTHRGKCYYLSKLFNGETLSHFIQNPSVDEKDLKITFDFLLNEIIEFCRNHIFDPDYNQVSGNHIKKCFKNTLLKLDEFYYINILLNYNRLIINGEEMINLNEAIEKIMAHHFFDNVNKLNSFISAIGHWNFHGDNILIKNLIEKEHYRVIDPDVSLDKCDPLFTLARFIYTYPHDTAEHGKYLINSNFLDASSIGGNYFDIEIVWPEAITDRYSKLFDSILCWDKIIEKVSGDKFKDENELFRFKINYLLCLLMGIKANYDETFTMPTKKIKTFQNKGVFLYLQTVIFANKLKDMLYEK